MRREGPAGLRRKPRVEYIPQDEKLGELYDEMAIETTGFHRTGTSPDVPLRFKVLVVNYIFAPTLDQKKLGK